MKFERKSFPGFFICYIVIFSPANLFSQEHSDTFFYSKAMENSMAVYHQSFGNQSAVYNGSMYNEYPFKFREGQPFFYAEEMAAGAVTYDGILYDSIVMQYNEITDVLVIRNQTGKIQLRNQKVKNFRIHNADFIRLESGNINKDSIGFYNLLYNGKLMLLKKQIKTIREEILNNSELLRFVDKKDHYYILKNEKSHEINSNKDFYKILGDHKQEVKQFVKDNKLSFRKDRQNMLTRAAAYYDSLK